MTGTKRLDETRGPSPLSSSPQKRGPEEGHDPVVLSRQRRCLDSLREEGFSPLVYVWELGEGKEIRTPTPGSGYDRGPRT